MFLLPSYTEDLSQGVPGNKGSVFTCFAYLRAVVLPGIFYAKKAARHICHVRVWASDAEDDAKQKCCFAAVGLRIAF